jgi:drug/metabolite transporter (DMT)-like permease
MTWQVLATGYLILGTAGYLVRRQLAQTLTEHNRIINGFFYLGMLWPLGLVVAAFSSPDLAIGWLNVAFLLAGSVMFPLIALTAYKASEHVDAGLYTILNNITPIITIITASVLLSESLNGQQLLGAFIIIASAFLVTLPRFHKSSKTSSAGIALALTSVTILGFAIVFERWMLTRIDFGAYLVFGWGAQTLWMTIFAWKDRSEYKILLERNNFRPILLYCVSNSFKGVCFVGALKVSGNASVVSAFTSFLAVLVVVSAYFILKEREALFLKLSAAAIGTTGLIILSTG